MFQPDAMKTIAKYADGVGPWKPMVISDDSTADDIKVTSLVQDAHDQGLLVHAYTFRADEGRIVSYAKNFADMVNIFFYQADVDGIFTDFPDKAKKAMET